MIISLYLNFVVAESWAIKKENRSANHHADPSVVSGIDAEIHQPYQVSMQKYISHIRYRCRNTSVVSGIDAEIHQSYQVSMQIYIYIYISHIRY